MTFYLFGNLAAQSPAPTTRSGRVLFIGLNPSTADETVDDPTCRKEHGFTARWGFHFAGSHGARLDETRRHRLHLWRGAYDKVNLFSLRSTDPCGLLCDEAPSAQENDETILRLARAASLVVCAWGGPYQPKALRELVAARIELDGDVVRMRWKSLEDLMEENQVSGPTFVSPDDCFSSCARCRVA